VTPLYDLNVASGDGRVARMAEYLLGAAGVGNPFEIQYRVEHPWGRVDEGYFHATYLGYAQRVVVLYAVEELPMALLGSGFSVTADLEALGAVAQGCRCSYWSDQGAPDSTCLGLAREAGVRLREGDEECMANGIYISSLDAFGEPSRLDWVLS
jgi:hypothetical protein